MSPGFHGWLVVQVRRTNLNPIVCGILATALAWGAYLSYYAERFGLDHPPSATGDEPDYDSLGWELAHGRGFRVDYSDPDFRRPYDYAAAEAELYRLTTTTRVGQIADRPPLLPFVMSLTNRLLGRQFRGIRIINALSMAVICGLIVGMLARSVAPGREQADARGSFWAVLPLASAWLLFVVVDTRTRLYGRAILTEALAAAEVAGLCWLLFRFANRPTYAAAAMIGVLLGVAFLTRTQFMLWLPGLAAIVIWLAFRRPDSIRAVPNGQGKQHVWGRCRRAVVTGSVMLAATLTVSAPWMVRNILVLGEFMPLGSQGWVQLSAAFGDSAWEQRGVWTNLQTQGFFDNVVTPQMSTLEAEVARAHFSRRKAREWIAAHPGRAVAMAPLKVLQELRPRTIPEGIILALSVLGGVIAWNDVRTRILLAVVLVCGTSIAVTWSVEGRFLVPLLFAQHGLIALGLARMWRRLVDAGLPAGRTA